MKIFPMQSSIAVAEKNLRIHQCNIYFYNHVVMFLSTPTFCWSQVRDWKKITLFTYGAAEA